MILEADVLVVGAGAAAAAGCVCAAALRTRPEASKVVIPNVRFI